MDFAWSDEQLALRHSIIEFARRELGDGIQEDDRSGTLSREKWRKCAEMGIHGLAVPEAYGGTGHDVLTAVCALEALGYGCADAGLLFAIGAQMWAVQAPILRFGTEAQRQHYLPRLLSGEIIGAHAITEPGSGSDTFSMRATAEKRGETYVLNGSKTFATNAPIADVFVVFASTNPARGFMGVTAFLVDKGLPGLAVGRAIDKMGIRTSPMGEVFLAECVVPVSARLGNEGNGGTIFTHSMGWERTCILAAAVGAMERQLETCVAYAAQREQFGRSIGKFQSVSNRIVQMKLRFESSRLLLYRAAWLRNNGHDATAEVAMAKLCISEAHVASSLDAIQIHGGYGYSTETGIERDLRDAIGSRIYSGTSEIQHEIIARAIGL